MGRMLRLLGRAISTVYWAWAGLLVYAGVFAEGQIFLPPPPSYAADDPGVLLLPGRGPTGAPVAARWWPGPEDGARAPLVLLYSHGNAEDLGQIAPLMRALADQGWAVLAYDYPGYGLSPGRCSERGCYHAIDAAYAWLRAQGWRPEQIVAYGRSVGSGSAIELARRHRLGGLILESAFTSAFATVLPWDLLPIDRFDNLAKAGAVGCPALLIHGAADRVIPASHARTLAAALAGPTQLVLLEDVGHNDLATRAGAERDRVLAAFRARLLGEPRAQPQ